MTQTLTRPEAWKIDRQSLQGKRVLVTGGTTGAGRTIALLLATNGANVVIFGRDRTHLDDALGEMGDVRDHVHGLSADVTQPEDIQRVFKAVDEELGGLDILINNAGIPVQGVNDTDDQTMEYAIRDNLLGYMRCAREATPRLQQAGEGMIINIGSLSAKSRGGGNDIYVATKAAIRGWSESIGKRLSEDRIRVSLIEPGMFGADFQDESPVEERQMHAEGEILFTEAIAEAVLYLVSQPRPIHVPLLQLQPLQKQVNA